jgi:hypothetical protein
VALAERVLLDPQLVVELLELILVQAVEMVALADVLFLEEYRAVVVAVAGILALVVLVE